MGPVLPLILLTLALAVALSWFLRANFRGSVRPAAEFDPAISRRAALQLTAQELTELRDHFLAFARSRRRRQCLPFRSESLSRDDFLPFLASIATTHGATRMRRTKSLLHSDPRALDFVFELFDTSHDGRVSLKEFIFGISILTCGTKDDRLRFLFYMYDEDGSGALSLDELRRVVTIMNKSRALLGSGSSQSGQTRSPAADIDGDRLLTQLFDTIDQSQNGVIEFDEFRAWAATSDDVMQWCDYVGQMCGDALADLRQKKEHDIRKLQLMRMGVLPQDQDVSFSKTSHSTEDFSLDTSLDDSASLPSIMHGRVDGATSTGVGELDHFVIDYDALQVKHQIDSGSYATVYGGEWLQLPVAIKVLATEAEDPVRARLRSALLHEGAILTQLRHPNILLCMGLCVSLERPLCVVSELFPGGSLRHHLETNGAPETAIAVKMALGVARGMLYLHSSIPPVLHRDLKSNNVLVDERDPARVVVCDFGLSSAAAIESAADPDVDSLPGVGFSMPTGTLYTMAPEVIDGGECTPSSEVYSFGILLWEVLSGHRPYAGMKPVQLMHYVVTGNRPKLDQTNDPLRKDLAALAKDCWAENAAARPMFAEVVRRLSVVEGRI